MPENREKTAELSQFNTLETKIEKLLLECASLRKEKAELANLLEIKNKEIQELQKKIEGLKEQRGVIGARIEGLLNKLEEVG